jgi:hypothetical protein
MEAKPSFLGHSLMENRCRLIVGACLTPANVIGMRDGATPSAELVAGSSSRGVASHAWRPARRNPRLGHAVGDGRREGEGPADKARRASQD